eukprot:scaffold11298_cov636-Chaetoceros_neogracile.AAC.1
MSLAMKDGFALFEDAAAVGDTSDADEQCCFCLLALFEGTAAVGDTSDADESCFCLFALFEDAAAVGDTSDAARFFTGDAAC